MHIEILTKFVLCVYSSLILLPIGFRVHVCTWNVKVTQPPDQDFRPLLHLDNDQELPDIVAVG